MAGVSKANLSRFQYLLERVSASEISRQTGIPRSTLYDFSRQRYDLSSEQSRELRNYYQRTAYNELRQAGMSREQARRFEWQTPEKATEAQVRTESVVRQLSEGLVTIRERSARARGEEWDADVEIKRAQEDVKTGLRKSRKTLEDWEKYQAA